MTGQPAHPSRLGTTAERHALILAAVSAVLVYPSRSGQDFSLDGDSHQNILGMVGSGAMNRIMILVKPDLIQGFKNTSDKRNVGVHEFAHLVDKSDGVIDGLPSVGLDREAIGPWVEEAEASGIICRDAEGVSPGSGEPVAGHPTRNDGRTQEVWPELSVPVR
jgi:hypothetical protein